MGHLWSAICKIRKGSIVWLVAELGHVPVGLWWGSGSAAERSVSAPWASAEFLFCGHLQPRAR